MGVDFNISYVNNIDALNMKFPSVGSVFYSSPIVIDDPVDCLLWLRELEVPDSNTQCVRCGRTLFTWAHGVWCDGACLDERYINEISNEELMSYIVTEPVISDQGISEMLSELLGMVLKLNEDSDKDYSDEITRHFNSLFKIVNKLS